MTVQCPIFLYPVSQSIGRQLCFILRTSLAGELTQNVAKQKSDQGKVLGEGIEQQILKPVEGSGDD